MSQATLGYLQGHTVEDMETSEMSKGRRHVFSPVDTENELCKSSRLSPKEVHRWTVRGCGWLEGVIFDVL